MFSIGLVMTTPSANRRRVLADLIQRKFKGDESQFRKVVVDRGIFTKGRVSQIFDNDKPWGERSAANLAAGLGLRDDYFERPHSWGGSNTELPETYSDSPSNKKRLQVREWVKAGAGGAIESVPLPEGLDLGSVEHDEFSIDGLYALRMRGDGLSPAIDDGAVMVIANPPEIRALSRVLVTMRDGRRLVLKLLVPTEHSITVAELVSQRQHTIERGDVERIEWVRNVYDPPAWSANEIQDA